MAVPLLAKKIVKKRVKKFKRAQSDRKICVKEKLQTECHVDLYEDLQRLLAHEDELQSSKDIIKSLVALEK